MKTTPLKEVAVEGRLTVGCDLGDRTTRVCVLDAAGKVVARETIPTRPAQVREWFERCPRSRVVLEVGTHSRWFSETVGQLGHEVIIANPRQLPLIYRSRSKTDELDAERLARIGRADPELLCPIKHRSKEAQADLALLRARDVVVRERTRLVNHIRGIVKPLGHRLPGCSAAGFADRIREELPRSLWQAVGPLLAILRQFDRQIAQYENRIAERAKASYPEVERMTQVHGVGLLTALTLTLIVEDKGRFTRSRDIGPFLGLVPRKSQTGESDPELRITKAGDVMARRLLVQCAHHILGPFGPDTDLRRYGQRVAGQGGKNAKKRAVVAVARKLAVLLHRLWVTGATYKPLGHGTAARKAA